MNKLTIVLSGRKQGGKTSSCNYIRAKYLNRKCGYERNVTDSFYHVNDLGDLYLFTKGSSEKVTNSVIATNEISVKLYSFADPLKKFLIDVFNIPYDACYGTDEQKNQLIPHILWENLPECVVPKITKWTDGHFQEFSGQTHESSLVEISRTGPMTGREIMQIWGTEICRKIYGDCWALGTYNAIKSDGYDLALIADGRFPNEITMGKKLSAKSIRLLRKMHKDEHASESALDEYPLSNYSLVIDNQNKTIDEHFHELDPLIDQWFDDAGI